jgi:hypothetical protein
VAECRVVIGTTTKSREFRFDDVDEARTGANDLWRWAKANNEHGTVSLYEQDGDRWLLVKTAKV